MLRLVDIEYAQNRYITNCYVNTYFSPLPFSLYFFPCACKTANQT